MNRTGRAAAFIFVLAATAMWALSPTAAGQDVSPAPGTLTIDVEGARPVCDAIFELVRRHGWAITYEELPPEYAGDMVDIAGGFREDGDVTRPLIVARGGRLRFSYDAQPEGKGAETVLQNLLREYGASDPPFHFRLARTGDVFHVIAGRTRNARGIHEERPSPLDARISLVEKERTLEEMIFEIVAAVQAKVGWRFGGPGMGSNFFSRTRVVIGADNESARSVLLRTLQAAIKRPVGWAVLCTPPGVFSAGCNLNPWVDRPPVPPTNGFDGIRKW